jgi:hypothetical protein
MNQNKTGIYSVPTLTITTFACEDVVRTSNQNLGGIPTTWKGLED